MELGRRRSKGGGATIIRERSKGKPPWRKGKTPVPKTEKGEVEADRGLGCDFQDGRKGLKEGRSQFLKIPEKES